jgi:hypothetical protein
MNGITHRLKVSEKGVLSASAPMRQEVRGDLKELRNEKLHV